MTNYEILKKGDLFAEMGERLHEDCWCCINHDACGKPKSKPSKEACKGMWRNYFKDADTLEKIAYTMYESTDCYACPVAKLCGGTFDECKTKLIAWLKSENVPYDIAIEKRGIKNG